MQEPQAQNFFFASFKLLYLSCRNESGANNLQITWVESRKKFVYDEILDSPSNKQKYCFQENINPRNFSTAISTFAKITLPPLTHVVVRLVITPKECHTPPPGVSGIAHIFFMDFPLFTDSIFLYENFSRNLDCNFSLSLICACSLSLSLSLSLSHSHSLSLRTLKKIHFRN